MLEAIGDAIGAVTGAVGDAVGDAVGSGIQYVLENTLYKLFYYIAYGLCWLLNLFNQMFEVFAGLVQVSYNNNNDYLINIFFTNTAITNAFWGMALIGIVMCFGFTIIAVVRKMFDSRDKIQNSLGGILGGAARSIVVILLLSAGMIAMLNVTNILMQRVNYLFNNADNVHQQEEIVFTDEDFATMGRVLATVGNYSLNPSHTSRYNLNSCFNEIRMDLKSLQDKNAFDYYYMTLDSQGNVVETWQSALQKIANSADLSRDLKMDVYYESVSVALLDTMNTMKVNGSFAPLRRYERSYTSQENVPLDRLVYLMGTMRAAKNPDHNLNPSLTDPLRGPYFSGEKSIYDIDSIIADFDIGFATDWILIYIIAWKLMWDLAVIILTCIARIFNLLMLYIMAPPFIAAAPLDDGAKTKQWLITFTVQCFSVFATVISMRLLLLYIPLVADANLVLFDSAILNLVAKVVLIWGGMEVVKKADNMITGILADSASHQAIIAGDMGATARGAMNTGLDAATGLAKGAASLGGKGALAARDLGVAAAPYIGKGAMMAGKGALAVGGAAVSGAAAVGGYAYKGASALAGAVGRGGSAAWNKLFGGKSDAGGEMGSASGGPSLKGDGTSGNELPDNMAMEMQELDSSGKAIGSDSGLPGNQSDIGKGGTEDNSSGVSGDLDKSARGEANTGVDTGVGTGPTTGPNIGGVTGMNTGDPGLSKSARGEGNTGSTTGPTTGSTTGQTVNPQTGVTTGTQAGGTGPQSSAEGKKKWGKDPLSAMAGITSSIPNKQAPPKRVKPFSDQ